MSKPFSLTTLLLGYPAYDYDYEIGPPFGARNQPIPVNPVNPVNQDPLPEKVEIALGTINDYLANPNLEQNISSVKITTSTSTLRPKRITTTTTVKPSTRRITTTITTEIIKTTNEVVPKRKKPTTSTDDAKDGVGDNNVTIKSCKF